MTAQTEINTSLLSQWINERLNQEEIEEKLMALGYDADKVASYIKTYNQLKHAKRQYIGFVLTGIGAFLGFISCVLTMINLIPELTNLFLYGLTTLAIVLVMIGLYYIFE